MRGRQALRNLARNNLPNLPPNGLASALLNGNRIGPNAASLVGNDAGALLSGLAGGGGLNRAVSPDLISSAALNQLGFTRQQPTTTIDDVVGRANGRSQVQLFNAIQDVVSRALPNQGLTQQQVSAA